MPVSQAHRPWPVPESSWIMKQIWHDLLFAHWPVRPQEIREMIPSGMTLDTFDGFAWIGVVPFRMSGIRLRGLPPIPFTDRFPEINVRTYVTVNGKPGVYFFSLDAANRLAVQTAKTFFHLPYFYAEMECTNEDGIIRYRSRRKNTTETPVAFEGRYKPVSPVFYASQGSWEYWLTERYCLYTTNRKREVVRGDILHLPWPLQQAEADIGLNTMMTAQSIKPSGQKPHLHFSKRLEVWIWPLSPG
nr:DUF2071 domain-containing protein [Paenibacillus hamazuiensis]